jgi:hypothetical protein
MARTSASRFALRTVVRTSWPAARSSRIAWLPMKPDPPVTRTVLIADAWIDARLVQRVARRKPPVPEARRKARRLVLVLDLSA